MNMDLLLALAALIVAVMVIGAILKVVRTAILVSIIVAVLGSGRLNSPASNQAASHIKTGVVAFVADGDTLTVRETGGASLKVRLLGIDSPEVHGSGPGIPECGGPEASAAMRRLADGKPVTVKGDPASGEVRDRYGRYLAYVTTRSGVDLGERQLRTGHARIYQFDGRKFSRLRRYRTAQRAAEREGRGTWTRCDGDFYSARPDR